MSGLKARIHTPIQFIAPNLQILTSIQLWICNSNSNSKCCNCWQLVNIKLLNILTSTESAD